VNTRNLDTFIKVKNGETRLLGGLLQSTDSSANSRVPFLGDIPGLGRVLTGRGPRWRASRREPRKASGRPPRPAQACRRRRPRHRPRDHPPRPARQPQAPRYDAPLRPGDVR
jgi:hypothetical protein